tara:strand:+ start:8151 stop:13616 length:5466 start_codon:yes stop_codon:yes gene_type:complete
MIINKQQKNIINPFAAVWGDHIEYDFSDYRNKFVIDVIHDVCVNYYTFLPQGYQLKLSVEDLQALRIEKDTPNLEILKIDLEAYNVLYPQNSVIVPDGSKIKLEMPSGEKSHEELSTLVSRLERLGKIDNYTSNSTPSSLLPENVNNTGPSGLVSRLVAFPSLHSNEYLTLMRSSADLQNQVSLDSFESIENFSMSTVATSFVNSDNNVDIYDWRANCGPGTDTNKVYYNTVDDKFYFTTRTDIASTQYFDKSYWNRTPEASRVLGQAVIDGLSGILKFTGKYSTDNLQRLIDVGLNSEDINFLTHLDVRPGSRWVHAIRVKRSVVNSLSSGGGPAVAYDEFEKTPLEKAQILTNPEQSPPVHKKSVRVANLIRYIPRVVSSIREYSIQLKNEGIKPEDIQGINLDQEATRLDSFIDMLSLAYIYNKFALDDDDVVEFVFSEDYKLKYFVVNGFIMTRGIGNKTFYSVLENENLPRKILNAFSLLSPTTFSLINNSYEIYSDESLRAEESRKPWPDFFDEYIYPSVELSPDKIREKAEESLLNFRLQRRQKLYTKIINLNKEGDKMLENLKRRNKTKYPYYQITTILSDMGGGDCNTAQAQALGDVLRFWQNISGKAKMRTLLRQAILLARDELIKDQVSKAYLSQAIQAGDNPRLFIREIEKKINQEIFCGLDVMGNVIETQILDPKNMSPELDASGKPPGIGFPLTIDLKVPKGVQRFTKSKHQRQTELYEEMVIKIILGFIQSIALGIIKDIIKASLGCGPDGPDQDTLEDALKDLRYGFLDLNEYLGDIDIVKVAKEADLYNIRRNEKDDPTLTQIQTFIRDISYMCTPSELDRLTFGDGDNTLYELILETVQNGIITFPADSNTDPEEEENETRTIDPTVYEDIQFSVEKIQTFFILLGDKMRDENAEELAKFTFSPLEAYCTGREPNLDTLGLEISREQLESQYMSLANDKIAKINAMCDWLRGLENIERQIQEIINSIPIMDGYNELLETIAKYSNALWQSIAEWWAKLFEEEAKNSQDPTYNLYTTLFGQDLFYSIRMLISRRVIIAQQRSAERNGEFIYFAPAPSRRIGHKISRVDLPYPPPDKLSDPWFSRWDIHSDVDDKESSYAVRTSPSILRQGLTSITMQRSNWNDDLPELYKRLHTHLEEYWKRQKKVIPPDQWISDFPTSNARCLMFINNIQDGGVRIFKNVKTRKAAPVQPGEDQFEIKSKLLAMYIPEPRDREDGVAGINYYRLLSGIGDKNVGGQNTGGPLINGPFAVNEEPQSLSAKTQLMPSRSNVSVTNLINDIMQGSISWEVTNSIIGNHDNAPVPSGTSKDTEEAEDGTVAPFTQEQSDQGGEISTVSVANWTEFIDENINDSYIRSDKKSKLQTFIRSTNKPPFMVNEDKCVTNEEVQIAQSIVLCIQSRIQYYFMNVYPLTRVYPHWNSFITNKIVTDYLYRKTYEELENRDLSYLIYDKMSVVQKVFGDVPENNLEFSTSQTPKDFIKELVGKIYNSMLKTVSKDIRSSIATSPYDASVPVTLERYKTTLLEFYKELKIGLLSDDNNLGLTLSEARKAIRFIDNALTTTFGEEKLLTRRGYEYGAYYFPIGAFIGLYLVTFDSVVDITKNFKSGRFKTQIEIAAADDSLLSNITGQVVTKYQEEIENFPATEKTWDLVDVTYFTKQEVEDRIVVLETTIQREHYSILLRTYPEFFARYGSHDLPEQVSDIISDMLYFSYASGEELTIANLRNRLEVYIPDGVTPSLGDVHYPAYVALKLLDEIEERNLPTLEETFGDLENLAATWRADIAEYLWNQRKDLIPAEKSRLQELLRI